MSPWASIWVWFKPHGLDQLLAFATPPAIKSWDAFVADCQVKRAKKQSDLEGKSDFEKRKDFFHWLWEARDPNTGKGYSIPELNSECELLVIAGSDTTTTVVSALFFYLVRDRAIQDKLAQEIMSTFTSYGEIRAGIKLHSCQYLTAFLHEGLRMAPAVGADLDREVLDGGLTVGGQYFPKGSSISTACWSMHYNPDYYPEPYQFRPERWIVGEADSTPENVALAESALCAFSTGPRGCVGKNMAWLEMRIIMAKLVWKFELRQAPDSNLGGGGQSEERGRRREGQYQTWDVFGSKRKGPLVQLKVRVHND
jgi:cytochrome P450